jgi:hypothetical protein
MTIYQSTATINNPIFIKSKKDMENINILGHGNRHVNNALPSKYKQLANGIGQIPYVNSHSVPKYLFIGAVVFHGKCNYEVLTEQEFDKQYTQIFN